MIRNRALANAAGEATAEKLGGALSASLKMRCAMAAIELHDTKIEGGTTDEMRQNIAAQHKIVAALFQFNDRIWFRLYAQLYNERADYLAAAKANPESLMTAKRR